MTDLNQVLQEENTALQRMDWEDMQAEMTKDLEYADKQVLKRIRSGETTHRDYLYMVGRLQYNLNDLEN